MPSHLRIVLLLALTAAGRIDTLSQLNAQELALCPPEQCLLRIRHSFLRHSLVQGQEERRVAGFTLFAPRVPIFQTRSDSAARAYGAFRARTNSGNVMGLAGILLITAGGFATLGGREEGIAVLLGGIGLTIGGKAQLLRAPGQLERAVWLYNQTLMPGSRAATP